MMILLTTAVVLAIATIASTTEIPEFIHVCKRNNPDLDNCITESITHIQPSLVKGVPELNVPSLEPLVLDELVAVQGAGLKISAKEIKTYGASDFTVSNLKTDLDKLVVGADVSLPHLYVDGMYHMDGKVLLLSLTGSGPIKGNFTECTGTFKLQAEVRKDEAGVEHLYCKDFNLKFAVGKGNIHFDNLFGGDKTLGDAVNTAINANFDGFIKELKPLVEKALSMAFQKIANNILESFTFEQLLPGS